MAFGELIIAKVIAMNAPKYTKIIEPFADGGTVAMYPGMRKPKSHIINIEDETVFNLMLFLQGHTPADKKKLKGMDWVSSPETFDSVVSLTDTEGAMLFYRFFYLKKFGVMSKDPDQPPIFDYLSLRDDLKSIIFTLPVAKVSLKKATITNDDPMSLLNGGSGTFTILNPKTPEQIESTESKLQGISGDYFYAKKSKSNDDLFDAVDNKASEFVSTFTQASIMMATMEVRTNYEHKSREKLKILEPIDMT